METVLEMGGGGEGGVSCLRSRKEGLICSFLLVSGNGGGSTWEPSSQNRAGASEQLAEKRDTRS